MSLFSYPPESKRLLWDRNNSSMLAFRFAALVTEAVAAEAFSGEPLQPLILDQ